MRTCYSSAIGNMTIKYIYSSDAKMDCLNYEKMLSNTATTKQIIFYPILGHNVL